MPFFPRDMPPEKPIQPTFGTTPPKIHPFADGDRVQVTEDWFQDELCGAMGVIRATPEGVEDRRETGIYWVQLNWPMGQSVGSTDAAVIDANYLRQI